MEKHQLRNNIAQKYDFGTMVKSCNIKIQISVTTAKFVLSWNSRDQHGTLFLHLFKTLRVVTLCCHIANIQIVHCAGKHSRDTQLPFTAT